MKAPDLTSTLVAGIMAALLLSAFVLFFDVTNTNRTLYAVLGFFVGVGVQVGVRVLGVS